MMMQFLLGTLVGVFLVGTSVQRTLHVDRGEVPNAIVSSILNSIVYYFSVSFVSKDQFSAYFGTTVGALAVVIYLTVKRKNEVKKWI